MGTISDLKYDARMKEAEAEGIWGVYYRQDDLNGDWCKYCHGLAGSVPDGMYAYSENGEEVTCQKCGAAARVVDK